MDFNSQNFNPFLHGDPLPYLSSGMNSSFGTLFPPFHGVSIQALIWLFQNIKVIFLLMDCFYGEIFVWLMVHFVWMDRWPDTVLQNSYFSQQWKVVQILTQKDKSLSVSSLAANMSILMRRSVFCFLENKCNVH